MKLEALVTAATVTVPITCIRGRWAISQN